MRLVGAWIDRTGAGVRSVTALGACPAAGLEGL